MNMNDLVRLGGLPRSALPDPNKTFNTTSSYIETLAELNLTHLCHQRNDAIDSADDCRRKYVARRLFLKLARETRLFDLKLDHGPFKLWCDDLRPANILLNEHDRIASVVDWEFTYAAPAEFAHAPPWWLLIEKPELWAKGIEDWTRVFDFRLKTFLKVMRECEDSAIASGRIGEKQRLSGRMERSWESGDFWRVYAVLHSFAFDAIYWDKIDGRFFGESQLACGEVWGERLGLLSAEEKEEMEGLVVRKVEEMEERVLVWDPDEYTVEVWERVQRKKEVEKERVKKEDETQIDDIKSNVGVQEDIISDKLATTHLDG